ncbi:MAG: hypothetical protein N4A72_12445 [Bacteroidales bacterium]|jgi:hypothetical protein|nr:hypothetical protein [Bacteroidales bacterium]
MNIALSSIILITLFLPGILFRTFIIKSDSFENPLETSLKAEIGFILIASIIIHGLGLFICDYILSLSIHLDHLYFLIIGEKDKLDFIIIKKSVYISILYIIIQSVTASFVAITLKKIAIKRFWDISTPYFPITSEWDNILSGRYYLFEKNKELKAERKKVKQKIRELKNKLPNNATNDRGQTILAILKYQLIKLSDEIKSQNMLFTKIDALVETQEGLILYRGSVYEYFLSKKNKLDKITLYNSFRRSFKPSGEKDSEFYEFNSNIFVIDYNNIKNLNVRYWFATEKNNNILKNISPD